MFRISFCALAFSVCLLALGCGAGHSKVTGTVTLDGQPVASATVVFTADDGSRIASGFTDASGNFSLTSDNKEGTLPGKYKVSVSKTAIIEGQSPATMGDVGAKVDPNYLKLAMKAKGTGGPGGPPKSGPPTGSSTTGSMSKQELPKIYSMPDSSPLPMVEVPTSGPVKLELKSKP